MPDTPRQQDAVDTSAEDSFPASDPPSHTPESHTGRSDATDAGAAGEATPKGRPSDDRHDAETASARIHTGQPAEQDER